MNDSTSQGLDFEMLAASLRADSGDLDAWVAALGTKLQGALPTRVRLRRGGIFGNGRVSGISVDLGPWRFELALDHGQLLAGRMHVVRGIALKSEPMPVDAWIDALSSELTALAASSARERAAILNLLS